ncbi:50S ribosomal protein L31e [Nanoarchaeota archaeon]
MAKKQEEKKLERTYNIPLRKEWLKVPKYKRAKKAVKALREFLMKHMKSEDVRIGKMANLDIWKHGIKNPPHHVKVTAIKGADGVVKAEMVGFEYKDDKPVKKEKKSKVEEMKEKLTGKKEEKKEEPKKVEKETELEKAVGGVEEKIETPKEAVEKATEKAVEEVVEKVEKLPEEKAEKAAEELVEEKKDVKEDGK